jgi:hypothetical protein
MMHLTCLLAEARRVLDVEQHWFLIEIIIIRGFLCVGYILKVLMIHFLRMSGKNMVRVQGCFSYNI